MTHIASLRIVPALTMTACAMIGARTHAQTPERAENGWEFQITPYVWAAGLKGDVGTRPNLPPAQVDESFSDILGNTDMALMVTGEARKGKWGLALDALYLSISADANTPGPLFGQAEAEATTYFFMPAVVYRVYDSKPASLDAGVGARYWHVKTELNLSAGLLPAVSSEETKSWVDPLLIVRGGVNLGSGFSLVGYGDIGGAGIGSDLTWTVMGLAQYRFNDWMEGAVGYRHMSVDYKDDGFVWDVRMSGPIVGVRFRL